MYKCLREGRGKGRGRPNLSTGGQGGQDMTPNAVPDPAYSLGPDQGAPTVL